MRVIALDVMPSSHGLTFCRKQLREKIRVRVRFFIRLSQSTWTDYSFGAHGPTFYCSYCAVTLAGNVLLSDYVTPIFYWTEVSAQGPIFYR